MTDILHATTQVLDLLVPLSDAERARVLLAARAVIDLSEDRGGFKVSGVAEGPVDKGDMVAVMDSGPSMSFLSYSPTRTKPAKEKPARRAQKAPRKSRTKSQPAYELESKILEAIRQGNSSPRNIGKTLGINSQSYAFRRSLTNLLQSGAVKATGASSGRHYHAGTTQ